MRTLIYNARLLDCSIDERGAILAENGIISEVIFGTLQSPAHMKKSGDGTVYVDAGGAALMPAFVDMHAHFRDPGFTYKEDMESGLKAAAAGGFGTVVLMPNTDPVVSSASSAQEIRQRGLGYGLSDVIQTVSITSGFGGTDTSHLDTLESCGRDRGNICAIPVVTEDGHDVLSAAVMLEAMEKCGGKNIIVSCHCEDPSLAGAAKKFREQALCLMNANPAADLSRVHQGSVQAAAQIKNALENAERLLRLAENTATERNLALAAAAGCPVHIAHVSTAEALDAVRRSKAERGSAVSCEVTPHHLALTSSRAEIVNPPLRSETDRQALVEGIIDGTVDMIATDHAPHSAEDKSRGAPGFSGLETAYALCNSILVQSGRITPCRLSALMSANPAKRLGLNRGVLKPGYEADFVLADPQAVWTVNPAVFFSKGKNTPVASMTLTGKVTALFRRGREIYRDGRFL